LSFSASQRPLEKDIHHDLVAMLQENPVSYSRVARLCNEAIVGLDSEEVSSSPKDDGLDQVNEVNEAILLVLSDEPFSSIRQIARKICVPKSCIRAISSACRFSAIHRQTSDIFIVFLTSSPIVNRQVDSSCRSNFATSCCPSPIKDRMGMHITCINL
jgi:hypothetical protein